VTPPTRNRSVTLYLVEPLHVLLPGNLDPGAVFGVEVPACAGMGVDRFYPDPGGSVKKAKAICGRCDVRERCLDFALENGEHGVWGGTTAEERRALKQDAA
jgi:WhiB family transcriptional regulator, redox-sensing transcriptional regulator